MSRKRDVDHWIWDVSSGVRQHSVEFMRTSVSLHTRCVWTPKVDLVEFAEHVLVIVELAGVELEQVELYYQRSRNILRVRGHRDMLIPSEDRACIHQMEITPGEFEREILLPNLELQLDTARADLSNGLLKVEIAKV